MTQLSRYINRMYGKIDSNAFQNELLYEFINDYRGVPKTLQEFMKEKNRNILYRIRKYYHLHLRGMKIYLTLANDLKKYTSDEIFIIFKFMEDSEDRLLRNTSITISEIAQAALTVNKNSQKLRYLGDILQPFKSYVQMTTQSSIAVYGDCINDSDSIIALLIKMINVWGEKESIFFLKYIFSGKIEHDLYMGSRLAPNNMVMRALSHDCDTWNLMKALYDDSMPMQWFVGFYIGMFLSKINGGKAVNDQDEFTSSYRTFLRQSLEANQ